MKFGTVINCMDGRVQFPVMDYLRTHFDLEYFDAANEAGPLKILTDRSDTCSLTSLKDKIRISLEAHGSRFIAVVGHHDCAGNPVSRSTQEKQIKEALTYLRKGYGEDITYVGLYVNDHWEVEEYIRFEP
jgi:hypothetical protein